MATTQKYLEGSITTLMTTELNSLASSSGLTAGAISSVGGSSGVFNNVAGGGGLDGYPSGKWELNLAAPTGAVSGAVYIWCIGIADGTNYEDGGSSVIPARSPDVVFPLRAVTSTAQRIIVIAPLPPGSWKVLLAQNSGQAFAGSGNTVKVVPETNQMV